MATRLSAGDARQSLNSRAALKGAEIFEEYGPKLGWQEPLRLLKARECVHYPCEIAFDAPALYPGEFAQPAAKGPRPEGGFTIFVHPMFLTEPSRVPYLVLNQLVVVNYGAFGSADDEETFGACALGLSKDEYYKALCEMADRLGG